MVIFYRLIRMNMLQHQNQQSLLSVSSMFFEKEVKSIHDLIMSIINKLGEAPTCTAKNVVFGLYLPHLLKR